MVVPLSVALVTILLLTIFAITRPPAWEEELSCNWRRINLQAFVIAILIGVFAIYLYKGLPTLPLTAVAVSTSVVTFALIQSVYTDLKLHLVDRRMLYLATLPPLFLHAKTLIENNDSLTANNWVIVILITGVLIFLPGVMGPSDGRALLLVAVAAYPIVGFKWFLMGLIFFIFSALIFGFVKTVRQGLPEDESKGKGFLRRLSFRTRIPAVPFILAPFIVTILLASKIAL